jgi:hypothetical protein
VTALFEFWEQSPTADQWLAAYFKYEPPQRASADGTKRPRISPEEQRRQAEQLIAMFGGGVSR